MARRPPPRPPKLRRGHGTRDPLPLVVVVCEGAGEKRCLEQLRGRWRIPSVKVEVVGQGGVPSTVIRKAKAWRGRGSSRRSSPPELWVVFDRDEHPCWEAAIDQALALDIRLGVSNPCFELWGILLHQEQNAWIHRHDAQRLLARLHPGYHHDRNPYLDLETVLALLDDTERRGARLLSRAEQDEAPFRNPTTRFHCLVARIRGLREEGG